MSTNPFGFDIPNIDDTTCSFEEYVEAARVMRVLSEYLTHKAAARRSREIRNIEVALFNEKRCELLYKLLPEWARW